MIKYFLLLLMAMTVITILDAFICWKGEKDEEK